MELNRASILRKTHDGLLIYAHVLSAYYPGEIVLSLRGRDCIPTKNPFNENKPTLKIQMVNECATHCDLEQSIPEGDALSFAEMFFKLEGNELLKKIDEELFLRIGNQEDKMSCKLITNNPSLQTKGSASDRSGYKPETINPSLQTKGSAPVFSYYRRPVGNTTPEKEIDLLQVYNLIKGKDFVGQTAMLRTIRDEKEARRYKATHFDYVTFSGTFSKRCDEALKVQSGLLTLDFDHIVHLHDLKERLLCDEYFETELLFFSPSGDGLKWIIAIDLEKGTHAVWFKAIDAYINATYQLEVDKSGKDVSRACFLPADSNIYINPRYLNNEIK